MSLKLNRDFLAALILAASMVIMGAVLGFFNNQIVTKYPEPGYHYDLEKHNLLSFMANWDGPDYIHIAENGYSSNFWINWFPAYPMAINIVHRVVLSALDSALLVSWVCLVGALYYYLLIVREIFAQTWGSEGYRAWPFWVLFPTGVFLIAPFSESLTAFTALAGIYMALKKKWLLAALFGVVCGASHITGIFAVLLMGMILFEQGASISRSIGTVVIGSLGLLGYMGYLWKNYGNPLGFVWSQQIFHGWTGHGYLNLIFSADLMNVINIALIIASVWYWRRRRISIAIFSAMFLAILIIGRQYGGFDRYVLLDFAIPWMLYGLLRDKNKLAYPLVIAGSSIAWTYVALQYFAGYIGS